MTIRPRLRPLLLPALFLGAAVAFLLSPSQTLMASGCGDGMDYICSSESTQECKRFLIFFKRCTTVGDTTYDWAAYSW